MATTTADNAPASTDKRVDARSDTRRAALSYAQHGWPVLPGSAWNGRRYQVPGTPDKITNGVQPTVPRNYATTDPDIITGWWSLDLSAVSGIYYRRPTNFSFHSDMSENERRWSGVQARIGFGGLLATLEPWLNHPHQIGYAEYKPVQLRAAVACELQVPRTLVTNEPDTGRAFVASVGRAIYKPFGGSGVYDEDGVRQVFCTVVSPDDCEDRNIARTMHLFQEWVPKDYEVRLTVVGGQFFAVRIDGKSEAAHVDWRTDYDNLSYQTIETPGTVRSRVSALLGRLGLRFGALDFVVAPDGEWWFLECNPNGQWAWIEEETGMPIAGALADALEGCSKRDGH